jgi:hypothetical protein
LFVEDTHQPVQVVYGGNLDVDAELTDTDGTVILNAKGSNYESRIWRPTQAGDFKVRQPLVFEDVAATAPVWKGRSRCTLTDLLQQHHVHRVAQDSLHEPHQRIDPRFPHIQH